MLSRITVFILAFSSLVAAQSITTVISCPPPSPTPIPISECPTGHAQCCNTVRAATDPQAEQLLDLLNIMVTNPDALVGLGCTPITIIGIGSGENCAQQPVCYVYDNWNGLIDICCSPMSL